MTNEKKQYLKRFAQNMLIIGIGVAVILTVVRYVEAGTLQPSSSPGSTMYSVQNVYDVLASTSFDSSALTADSDGNAFQIVKCMVTRIHGGSCP